MSIDDRYGIGAGLLALGLAAGVILLGQLTYNKDAEAALVKESAVTADAGKAASADAAPAVKPSLFYRIIPHRELNRPEAIFDGIVCALALPTGIFFFVTAILAGAANREEDLVEVKPL